MAERRERQTFPSRGSGQGPGADRRLIDHSALIALVIPTVVVILAGASSVARVGDAGDIPRGIPVPHLPDLGLFSFSLVTGALAIAAIVLVQAPGSPSRRRIPTARRQTSTGTSSRRRPPTWLRVSSGARR